MPEISVIVPVYNVEAYLNRCIDSLLSQTFDSFELILVDDCSSDSSGKICDEYALSDDRVKVYHNPVNKGASDARNFGMSKSTGKYIMFCDSDDYVADTILEKLHSLIKLNGVELAICGRTEFFSDASLPPNNRCYVSDSPVVPKSGFLQVKRAGMMDNVIGKLYIADIIKSNKLKFSENVRRGEDTLFALEYTSLITGSFGITADCLYFYDRCVPNSLSKQYVANIWDTTYKPLIAIYTKIMAQIKDITKLSPIDTDTFWLWIISNAIQMNMSPNSNLSLREVFRKNQAILSSEECKSAFRNNAFVGVHPLYKAVLKTRCFLFVWLFMKAVDLKHRIIKK